MDSQRLTRLQLRFERTFLLYQLGKLLVFFSFFVFCFVCFCFFLVQWDNLTIRRLFLGLVQRLLTKTKAYHWPTSVCIRFWLASQNVVSTLIQLLRFFFVLFCFFSSWPFQFWYILPCTLCFYWKYAVVLFYLNSEVSESNEIIILSLHCRQESIKIYRILV